MENFLARSRPVKVHPAITLARKKVYDAHLTENDVVALCDIFLTPSIHYVTFTSLATGRKVMHSFIDHLTCYHAIGYIDRIGISHQKGMNLYEFFAHYESGEHLREAIEQFFLERFNYDFIWIVYPKYQVAQTFIQVFLDCVVEYRIDQKIPIIFLST